MYCCLIYFSQHLDEDDQSFVENYKKKIYEIAYSILRNKHDAEDIVDEVMINVIKNIEKFVHSDGNEILAQLVIYSRNAAINLYKTKKRRDANEMSYTYINEEGEYEDVEVADEIPGLNDVLLSRENSEIVLKYLRQLTQGHPEVIICTLVLLMMAQMFS